MLKGLVRSHANFLLCKSYWNIFLSFLNYMYILRLSCQYSSHSFPDQKSMFSSYMFMKIITALSI